MSHRPKRGAKTGKFDAKSEAIREKHGDSYENYPSVKPAADKAVKENKTGR